MSPALLLALALQASPAAAAADPPQLAELRRAWEVSCADRAYGAYDDVCTQMSDQIRAYERESRKAARRPTPPPAAGAVPAAPAERSDTAGR